MGQNRQNICNLSIEMQGGHHPPVISTKIKNRNKVSASNLDLISMGKSPAYIVQASPPRYLENAGKPL